MDNKSSGVAIVLSCFWTGLGQLYAGRIARGILLMVGTPIVWTIGWFGGFAALGAVFAPGGNAGLAALSLVVAAAPIAYWLFGMVDAKKLCEQHNLATVRGYSSAA